MDLGARFYPNDIYFPLGSLLHLLLMSYYEAEATHSDWIGACFLTLGAPCYTLLLKYNELFDIKVCITSVCNSATRGMVPMAWCGSCKKLQTV